VEHPITINRSRQKTPLGGNWQEMDSVARGRVQILPAGSDALTQTMAVMAELERLSRHDPAWDWAKVAVIAREWKYLQPLRSYCELQTIPVQMAYEESIPLWRLRETQALVNWLRSGETRLVDGEQISDWLKSQPVGPWWSLLAEAVEEYGLETNGVELPNGHFIDWLAEWGREVRRRQTGLMLLTAHRAKGLEFDHVVVLDGGWDKVGNGEDQDAPRRLFYVAMTRARKTLVLAHMSEGNSLINRLPDEACLLHRSFTDLPPPPPEFRRQYHLANLTEVDMGFAGRYAPGKPVHEAIAQLQPGDPLKWTNKDGLWELLDEADRLVGRLSRGFVPPKDMALLSVRVAAILVSQRDDADPEYQDRFRCEQWEFVVPELVFAPISQ
jgi:ATP-dependent DNA helicase RecQ